MNTGCHVIGIKLTCGICGTEHVLDNPLGLALGMLIHKAQSEDWFVPGEGQVLCPSHMRAAAAKYNLPSLFTDRPRVALPTPQTAARGKKAPSLEEK